MQARLAASLYYWSGTEARRESLVLEALAIARELDDPATLARVLSNGQLATWGPYYTGRDLRWMEELLELLEGVDGSDELELVTRNRQIDFLVELGDLAAADSALRALELTVGSSADPRAEGYAYLQRARHAVIEGRFAEAERLNTLAVRVGEKLRDTNMVILAANRWRDSLDAGAPGHGVGADSQDARKGRDAGLAGRTRAGHVRRGSPRRRAGCSTGWPRTALPTFRATTGT